MEQLHSHDHKRFGPGFKEFFRALSVELWGNSKDTAMWNEVVREIRSQITHKNAWVSQRRIQVYHELRAKYDNPDGLLVVATERAEIEHMCAAKNFLPRGGASDAELTQIGLRTDTRPTNPHFGNYRPAIFPEGWDMRPLTPDPEPTSCGNAVIYNETGEAVADVIWRLPDGATNHSYVSVIEQPTA